MPTAPRARTGTLVQRADPDVGSAHPLRIEGDIALGAEVHAENIVVGHGELFGATMPSMVRVHGRVHAEWSGGVGPAERTPSAFAAG